MVGVSRQLSHLRVIDGRAEPSLCKHKRAPIVARETSHFADYNQMVAAFVLDTSRALKLSSDICEKGSAGLSCFPINSFEFV